MPWGGCTCPSHTPLKVQTALLRHAYNSGMMSLLCGIAGGRKFVTLCSEPCAFKHLYKDLQSLCSPFFGKSRQEQSVRQWVTWISFGGVLVATHTWVYADFVSFSKVPWTHQDGSYLTAHLTALALLPSAWGVSSPKVTMACTLPSSRLNMCATFPVLSFLATLLKSATPSPNPLFPMSHHLSPYIYLKYLIWHILPYLSCVY